MEKLLRNYAKTILTTCLKIEKNQPLFIYINIERIDFLNILIEEANKLGVEDIWVEKINPLYLSSMLKINSYDELIKLPFWNGEKWNEYAEKGAAFAMIHSLSQDIYQEIDKDLINDLQIFNIKSKKRFNELRHEQKIQWCIAAAPTKYWGNLVFPYSENPEKELWNTIFKICNIDESDNCEEKIESKIVKLQKRAEKLNSYKIKKLKYTNELGTNFEIELPQNHLWQSGKDKLITGKEVIVNFPTEEVFTSPDYKTANGIVYSSKPLCYQNQIIENFYLEFKDGKVINCKAEKGNEILENIIKNIEGMNQLGEVALVPYDSPISNQNITFYETLFDENASCHLALGSSFPECLEDGLNKTKKELYEIGLNQSDNHIDFMIGTKDTKITAITQDGKEILVFENGNFTSLFE